MENIAVIIPSRGMSFSKTMEELLRELKPFNHKLFFSIGNPLPDCFNIPVEEALKDEFTHILIVEDDMIIPKGILRTMLNKKYPVVALDYPFVKDGDATTLHDPSGMALYTGTGFMLIERWVLDAMPKPIFRTGISWDMMITKDDKLIIWSRDVSKSSKAYGLHDVNFGLTMWSNNIPILVPDKTAGQRKLHRKGEANVNTGVDEIIELTHVWRDNTAKTANTGIVAGYLERLHKVKSIEVLDKPPKGIYYKDGQAHVRGNHAVV